MPDLYSANLQESIIIEVGFLKIVGGSSDVGGRSDIGGRDIGG